MNATDATTLSIPEPLALDRGADGRALAACGTAAIAMDVALRLGPPTIAGALLIVLTAVGLLASGRVTNRDGRVLVAAAIPFGLCLAVRSSFWLLPFDILAAGALLCTGVSLARTGRLADLSIRGLAARALHVVGHGIAAPAFLVGALPRPRRSWALVRGALLAVPLVAVLLTLLASADAVFAAALHIDFEYDGVVTHAVMLTIGAWGMAGLLRVASARPAAIPDPLPWRIGVTEATIVLGSLVAVYAAFVATQIVVVAGGADHVLRTAGLTYAEHARTGFVQLLAAVSVTVAALLALRSGVGPLSSTDRRRITALSVGVIVLTLVLVGLAIRRLGLYQHAFGLTMPRLYATVFASWVGAVLVLLAGALAVEGRRERPHEAWFLGATGGLALAVLLALNIVNPEALVVRANIAHAERTGRIDVDHLLEVSSDGLPAIVDALPRLDPRSRARVLSFICDPYRRDHEGSRSWLAYNGAADAAVEARNRACS